MKLNTENLKKVKEHLKGYKPKGDIKDFPIEVIEWMCYNQVEQENELDVEVFEKYSNAGNIHGGFNWTGSLEGDYVWRQALTYNNFEPFYQFHHSTKEEIQKEEPVILKKGMILIAKNDGEIIRGKKTLMRGEDYEILEVEDEEFVIKSEINDYHYFNIEDFDKFFKTSSQSTIEQIFINHKQRVEEAQINYNSIVDKAIAEYLRNSYKIKK